MGDKSKLNPTKRFGNRVENYAKYRPSYPEKAVNYITNRFDNPIIADIGSGTGILTKLVAEKGIKVYGVEPNEAMRKYAEKDLAVYKNFESVDGGAEETRLPDKSVDIITVAQAFHWFDREKSKKEFVRILKNNGQLALIWNDRKIEKVGFSFEYEEMVKEMCHEYNEVTHKNITDSDIEEFYTPFKVEKMVFENSQEFSYEELKGRLMSSSYVPVNDTVQMAKIETRLIEIFNKYSTNQKVRFDYETTLYTGRLK